MNYINNAIKYTEKLWNHIQTAKSEYAHEETYRNAEWIFTLPTITKRGRLKQAIKGCIYIIHNDFRQDTSYFEMRLYCLIKIEQYRCKTFTKFVKHIMPLIMSGKPEEIRACQEIAREIYDVDFKLGGKFNALHS